MKRAQSFAVVLTLLSLAFLMPNLADQAVARIGSCPPFHLRNDDGEIINPITGVNADQPYSTRQTCGKCHDYDKITSGYHFQQGWDVIKDDFNKEKPWMLSDGMFGKM